jgi:Dynamin family
MHQSQQHCAALLNALIGEQWNEVGGGSTTTRCPIKMHLHHTDKDGVEFFRYDATTQKNVPWPLDDLRADIKSKNMDLQRRGVIAKKPIEISVYSRRCGNFTIIDTPGVISCV